MKIVFQVVLLLGAIVPVAAAGHRFPIYQAGRRHLLGSVLAMAAVLSFFVRAVAYVLSCRKRNSEVPPQQPARHKIEMSNVV